MHQAGIEVTARLPTRLRSFHAPFPLLRHSDLPTKPFGAILEPFLKLWGRPLASECGADSFQLLFQSQSATCHLFRLRVLSRTLGLNPCGGVTACPNSPQGSQRKIRTPTLETLSLIGRPQNPHRPLSFAILERLGLSFSNSCRMTKINPEIRSGMRHSKSLLAVCGS